MKRKIKYTDEPIGKVKVITDFLPSPEELALKDETVKVTISLSKTSVDFFKKEAKKYNTRACSRDRYWRNQIQERSGCLFLK